jgi:hypothetical protein
MWLCTIGYNHFFPFAFVVSKCKKDNKLARDKIIWIPFPKLWISQVGQDPFS